MTVRLTALGLGKCDMPVATLEEAAQKWNDYRDFHALGSSMLLKGSGIVMDEDQNMIARVSFNGRVWDMEGKCIVDIAGGVPLPKDYRYKEITITCL